MMMYDWLTMKYVLHRNESKLISWILLNQYMQEAYCLALSKLKEAMKEPQQNSMAFINNMHSQLRELTQATSSSSEPDATTSSSECTFRRNPSI